jgi:hypothetical protein
MRNRTGLTVLAIGLIAGTLDIGENLIFNQLRGVAPWTVFQYIASGLMGMGRSKAARPPLVWESCYII